MQLGTAKIKITPKKPLRLCGYATRTTVFDEVREDIYLRVQVHCEGENRIVFLYGDVLWWGSDFVKEIRAELTQEFQLKEEELFLVASHNHSGPPTGNHFTAILETYDKEYAAELKKNMIHGVRMALETLTPVRVKLYTGESTLNVFRRKKVDGLIKMKPNYQESADHTLTIVGFFDNQNKMKGSLIHYPCHANLSNENMVHPDYPGLVLKRMDEEMEGSVSIFLQGCTADLRPNSVLGDDFIACDYERVKLFATKFYEDCHALLMKEGKEISPTFCITRKTVPLPLENLKTAEELEDLLEDHEEVWRQWAGKVLEKDNRAYEELEASRLSYGDDFNLYFLNGEISQDYATFARTLHQNAITVAYANGMIGYLCTQSQILEGGYEPVGSALYFALAGTYQPEIETIIKDTIKEL